MKPETEVLRKYRDLKFRYLQKLLRRQLKRRPHTCQFNREHTFEKDGVQHTVRLCMLGVERPDWDVDICESPKQAATCPAFLFAKGREDLEAEFEELLRDEEYVRSHYKDLYILMWLLGEPKTEYTWYQRLVLFVKSWIWTHKALPQSEEDDGHDEDRD